MASSQTSLNPVAAAEPSLDTLVNFLLAAKRSLSTIDTVQRANELVTTSKASFVSQVALAARTSYLLTGCTALHTHLAQMHSQLGSIASETASEVSTVVASVSAAERRLHATLDGLRSTIVDPKLRPPTASPEPGDSIASAGGASTSTSTQHATPPSTLLDFVDRAAAQSLLDEVSAQLADTDQAQQHYTSVVDSLGASLEEIAQSLSSARTLAPLDSSGADSVPSTLGAMEGAAHSMAENLESLVTHYDSCLSMLRHTEGAGAAMSHLSHAGPESGDAALAHEISPDLAAAPGARSTTPVDADERAHMMAVLASDAAEVPDVVAEMAASLTHLQALQARVDARAALLARSYAAARAVFAALEAAEERLPHYSTQSHLLVVKLDGAKAAIADKAAAVDELAAFYAGFLGAYDRLVIEVGRRKDIARRVKRVRDEAAARLDALWREDGEERDAFRADHGQFLPRDIWPGLEAPPPRYEVVLTEGEASVPDVSASTVQRAIRRVSGRPEAKKERST